MIGRSRVACPSPHESGLTSIRFTTALSLTSSGGTGGLLATPKRIGEGGSASAPLPRPACPGVVPARRDEAGLTPGDERSLPAGAGESPGNPQSLPRLGCKETRGVPPGRRDSLHRSLSLDACLPQAGQRAGVRVKPGCFFSPCRLTYPHAFFSLSLDGRG